MYDLWHVVQLCLNTLFDLMRPNFNFHIHSTYTYLPTYIVHIPTYLHTYIHTHACTHACTQNYYARLWHHRWCSSGLRRWKPFSTHLQLTTCMVYLVLKKSCHRNYTIRHTPSTNVSRSGEMWLFFFTSLILAWKALVFLLHRCLSWMRGVPVPDKVKRVKS